MRTAHVLASHRLTRACSSSVQSLTHAATWGNPDNGRLGFEGSLPGTALPRSVQLPQSDPVIQVACGGAHTLFLTQAGHVYSAGSGEHGQLGHGDTQEQPVPRRIEGISGALAVAAGAFHSLVITDQGLCSFGRNQHGALGLGHTQYTATFLLAAEMAGTTIMKSFQFELAWCDAARPSLKAGRYHEHLRYMF
eukprot:TRINITY_DN7429_c0_g1_i17.p1 TRINITY_DN7429_c0_g1~~TRINITY_DN7429_c0_g1_i17.p1  ORF type:complete len:193 (+),score=23.48 TRINITY_DN7429_c0_g1_i17:147-725(+)